MITKTEDYLALLQDIQNNNVTNLVALVDVPNEKRFVINANTREIDIPQEFQEFLAMRNDHNAEKIYFEIDRYFDDVDLSTKTCVVHFVNANHEAGIYPVQVMDVDTVDGKIIFEWALENGLTYTAGNISFAVRFYSMEDEEFTYNLNTKTYWSVVLDTIEPDDYNEVNPEVTTVIDNLVQEIEDLKSISGGEFATEADDIDFSDFGGTSTDISSDISNSSFATEADDIDFSDFGGIPVDIPDTTVATSDDDIDFSVN